MTQVSNPAITNDITRSIIKDPIKDPVWRHIQDLAFDYYADREDKAKRDTLHNALFKKLNPKDAYSPIENLARTIVKATPHRRVLGGSVTYLSEEALAKALDRTNKASGLPYARATALLDYGYDPSKGAAFHTWFSLMLRSVLTDMLRSHLARRKHEISSETDVGGAADISGDEADETEQLLGEIFKAGETQADE
jgi:hypothetical protein